MPQRGLILFAHGARAASWAAPFERLRDMTQARMPDARVALAFLELMTPQLPELAAQLVADGVAQITVVPVFLGQGGHVLRDLPLLLEQLRQEHPGVAFQVAGAVGEDPTVLAAMTDYCVNAAGDAA
ncbi:CbiX/SirB N-terminal domain-containing protein [Rugamonas sp. CCM 8940]|nr:CbiX/SirB N-terminal domain-containing protein [Rugamonas sp. CCM 8940]MBJ7314297.1 CbiX/SirB N-terminal domain-containing protein [Rugamonas sp. CCM 8940]